MWKTPSRDDVKRPWGSRSGTKMMWPPILSGARWCKRRGVRRNKVKGPEWAKRKTRQKETKWKARVKCPELGEMMSKALSRARQRERAYKEKEIQWERKCHPKGLETLGLVGEYRSGHKCLQHPREKKRQTVSQTMTPTHRHAHRTMWEQRSSFYFLFQHYSSCVRWLQTKSRKRILSDSHAH